MTDRADEVRRALEPMLRDRLGAFPAADKLRDQAALPAALLDRLVDERTTLHMPHFETPTRLRVRLRLDGPTGPEPPEVDDATTLQLGSTSFRRIGRAVADGELTLIYEGVRP